MIQLSFREVTLENTNHLRFILDIRYGISKRLTEAPRSIFRFTEVLVRCDLKGIFSSASELTEDVTPEDQVRVNQEIAPL